MALERLEVLIGEWSGTGEGFGVTSSVEHSYEYVLQNRFIHSRTRSEPQGMGEPGVVDRHEDWGFFSFDPERGAIIFRQFHSEGYVNVYVLEDPDAPGDTWVFKSERTEGAQGMRARLRWKVHPPNEYEVILELAPVGEGFKPCQQVHMRRREAPS